MTLEGETVLVTGGAGFIGSHLVEAMVGNNAVRILDDFSTGRREWVPGPIDVFEGDVRDDELVAEAMAGADIVFHLAAQLDVARSVEHPRETHAINVAGTMAVLESARATDARVVFASSAAVYGTPERVPVREADRTRPTNPYGLSKRAAEEYCRLYSELYGIETVALRFFNVYGPRQSGGHCTGVISEFVAQASSGAPITVHGDGTQTRDFVHVDDVVRANMLAATSADAAGGVFNIGTGESVTVRELAELLKEVTGSDSAVAYGDSREGDIERSRADSSKAADRLGFDAEVSLRAGITDLVR